MSLIQDNGDIISFGHELGVAAPYELAIALFCFDYEKKFVHKCRHAPSGADRCQRRHVENDIVKIARLEIRHKVEEFLQPELGRPGVGITHRGEEQITGLAS